MLSVAQSMNHDSQANTTSTNNDSSKPNNTDKTHTVSHKKYEIGDFIIEHKLGQGGFGKVFLATHKHTLEPVAIKLINKTVINNNIQLQCIQNEINIHKRLYHEAIVRHYCVLETHSTISMVTEYCPNGELFDYISRHKRLDEKDACRLFQQLISGLYYMHQQSIAHRDIKLDNLLLTSNNQLKIADFGLSKYYTNTLSTLCGCHAMLRLRSSMANNTRGRLLMYGAAELCYMQCSVDICPFMMKTKQCYLIKSKKPIIHSLLL